MSELVEFGFNGKNYSRIPRPFQEYIQGVQKNLTEQDIEHVQYILSKATAWDWSFLGFLVAVRVTYDATVLAMMRYVVQGRHQYLTDKGEQP